MSSQKRSAADPHRTGKSTRPQSGETDVEFAEMADRLAEQLLVDTLVRNQWRVRRMRRMEAIRRETGDFGEILASAPLTFARLQQLVESRGKSPAADAQSQQSKLLPRSQVGSAKS